MLGSRECQAYYRLLLATTTPKQRNAVPLGLPAICYEDELKALNDENNKMFGNRLS
jgi:hypothetical protein